VISLFDDDWKVWKRAHAGLSEAEASALQARPEISPAIRREILADRYRLGNSYFVPHDSQLGTQLSGAGISTQRPVEEFVDWHPEDFLFVPMRGKNGKVLGTISVDDPADGRRPTPESLTVLELFAREAAIAIEQNQLLGELERAERYLENLVTNSADAIVTTDTKGRIVVWNQGAVRMLGWTREEIVGESVLRLYADEEAARVTTRRLFAADDEDPGRVSGYETLLVSKSGEKIPVALSASALYGVDGEFLGTAGISRDLRPWKKLEQELVAAEKAATLGEVAATLCHEINNFLEEILSAGQISLLTLDRDDVRTMYVDAGKQQLLDREVERVKALSREALKIASITNRLQEMARGGTYETTEYVGDIRMAEIAQPGATVQGARILIADDREYIREFLKDFLELNGFEVDLAEDGRQAVEMAQRKRYDLVLSDIKMPFKNGYEVFEGVRESHPDTKVILMTAYGYDPSHSIVKASSRGLSDVLYKPFQMARVRDAITKALLENGGMPKDAA
jgi:PAS domain S-box-containing protein